MMIPWEPIFHFGVGTNLKKKSNMAAIVKIATVYFNIITAL